MKRFLIGFLCAALAIVTLGAAPPQKDDAKCKDDPLFTRMPGFWIHNCDQKQFYAYDFVIGKGKTEHVEGRYTMISYYPQNDLKEKPSDLQIQRNFENAVQRIGGKVLWSDKGRSTLKLTREGKEYWVNLSAEFTSKHGLIIIQREAMKQDIVADAKALTDDLHATGHATVYGITFDTDSAVIRPESAAAVGEIAKVLQADAALNIFVVGHTDNAGTPEHNLKLSQDRAQAVMQALIRDHGIAASRLRPFGCGPYAPVATNASEEGRAKNRRVELVKQ